MNGVSMENPLNGLGVRQDGLWVAVSEEERDFCCYGFVLEIVTETSELGFFSYLFASTDIIYSITIRPTIPILPIILFQNGGA